MRVRRLLIVGWDGAEPAIVDRLLRDGRLPNLAGLVARGCYGRLRSTVPDTSLAAWTSALTGQGPGEHGLVNFVRRPAGRYRLELVDAGDRLCESLLSMASRAGLRVAALGIPGTWPPEAIDGVCIAGFDSPLASRAAPDAHLPAELLPWLRKRGLDWPYGGLDELSVGQGWHQRLPEVLRQNIRTKLRVAEALAERGPFDLAWIVFSETDTAGHHLWAFADSTSPRHRADQNLTGALDGIYQELDRALGRLLQSLDEDASVLVLSDHGMGGASDVAVYLNRFLAQKGFLRFSKLGAVKARLFSVLRDRAAVMLPPSIKQTILRSPLRSLALSVDGLSRFGGLDLGACQAFSDELPQNPGIWIHRAGRDPKGCVPAGQAAERLKDDIAEALLAWRDPLVGGAVVARVLRREQALPGQAADRAPDLLVELARPGGHRLVAGWSEGRPGPSLRKLTPPECVGAKGLGTSGAHTPDGILIAAGAGMPADRDLTGANLVEVCPTALRLLDLEPPPGLAGRPLPAIAPLPGRRQVLDGQAGDFARSGYSASQRAAVARRLAELGYL